MCAPGAEAAMQSGEQKAAARQEGLGSRDGGGVTRGR
jgi:hypothetical protein